jgi:regulator of RNase E activity RraA
VVHPGDVVVCDTSGVLVMPPDEAEPDIDWALSKQANEPASHEELKRGEKLGARTGASAMVEAKLSG